MVLKISDLEKTEIIKHLKDVKYKPNIANNLFKKINSFKQLNNQLFYNNKLVITTDKLNGFLTSKYNDALWGRDKLYKTLAESFEGISRQDIDTFLKKSNTHQLHTVPKKEKIHNPIVSTYPLERIQADIVDLDSIKGFNHQHRYVLTIIDHFSKYAWAYTMTQKSANKVYDAFNDLITNILKDKQINILQTDNGKEFLNKKLTDLLNKHKIKHITSTPYSPRTQGVIERFNRTLKQMIFKRITENKKKDFINFLNELIHARY